MVATVYSDLKPEDTYVHGSTVKVNRPVGTISGDSIQAIDAIFKALERMAVRALKSMPLLLGTNQSRTETQANREWEIFAKGIEIIQHPVEKAFEDLMELYLQARGILADVSFKFAQFRGAEEERDERVAIMKISKARRAYDCGYISQDEAAMMAVGKATADAKEPRDLLSGALGNFGLPPADTNPDNINTQDRYVTQREALTAFRRIFWPSSDTRQPNDDEQDEARDFWKQYAPDDAKDLIDADLIIIQEEDTEQ
jgi:hypothetical protein